MEPSIQKVTLVYISLIVLGFWFSNLGYTKIDPKDIIGVWLFDEESGNTIKDSSGNGNDGEALGKFKRKPGKFGGGFEFPGVDGKNHIEIPDPKNAVDALTESFAISMWVKINTRGTNQRMFSYEGGGKRNIVFEVNHGVGDVGRIVYTVGGQCCNWADAEAVDKITDSKWHHVVGIFNSKDDVLLTFTDGKIGQKKCMGNPGDCKQPADAAPDGTPLVIGSRPAGTGNLDGMVDDIALFNRGLTKVEILEIRDSGLERTLAISPKGKLAAVWGRVKGVAH